jgi:RimJ/RimL family protein N-acetyltransferase
MRFRRIRGYVLADNHRMLRFVRRLGFAEHRRAEDGHTVLVERDLDPA